MHLTNKGITEQRFGRAAAVLTSSWTQTLSPTTIELTVAIGTFNFAGTLPSKLSQLGSNSVWHVLDWV